MRDLKNKLTSGKNTKNIQARKGKSFGYQVLGFGAGGGRTITPFIIATGGSISTSGDFKTHIFTGNATFCVSNEGNACGSNAVDYLVVAGGAAGSGRGNGGGVGGGGAGGIRIGTVGQPSPLSPSPLVAPGHTLAAQGYPIVVGSGGPCSTANPASENGDSGQNSSFSSFTAAGGGGGSTASQAATAGGSGGGGGEAGNAGGAGNTPPVSPAQGSAGGAGNSANSGAGGGGFTQTGSSTPSGAAPSPLGQGGNGINAGPIFSTINGEPGGNFGGGGGASQGSGPPGKAGGSGGGGTGSGNNSGTSGDANTGGGGGGAGGGHSGTNAGGSGIVIIRYKFQQENNYGTFCKNIRNKRSTNSQCCK